MYQYLAEGQKKRLFSVVMFVLVLLAIFLGIQSLNSLKEGQFIGRGDYPANVVSVNGEGEVFAVPDIGSFSFSVVEEGKTSKDAQDKASTQINKVLEGIRALGIEDKDIKTTAYNLYPKYEYIQAGLCASGYCPPSKQVLSGYEVSQTITIKVRKVDQSGEVLTKAGSLGAKNISGLDFIVDDLDKVKSEARDKAITDAKQKADVLARSLGVKLKRIVNFSESGSGTPIYFAAGMAKVEALSADMAAPVPQIPVGENKVVSNVTITYEVE